MAAIQDLLKEDNILPVWDVSGLQPIDESDQLALRDKLLIVEDRRDRIVSKRTRNPMNLNIVEERYRLETSYFLRIDYLVIRLLVISKTI